jgi:hypothetical protein
MRRFFGPGLVLFFLAPAIGEITCGNRNIGAAEMTCPLLSRRAARTIYVSG